MCEEKMLSQLTGDMYEFYQWLKSKCSGVVGVDVTYGKTHRDGSEDVCMTFQLQYHWENERDKRKDAGIHKIVAIMEYIAKKFNWDIDIKWFNSYRAATDDVLMIKVINQKENLTTEVKSKMKKLPITKEAFEKSRYFKDKYGNLEYVSESGKVFKTNKGKVLKFKESKESLDDYLSKIDFNDPRSLGWEQGFSGRDLRTMGYKDLDDYWRQKDSERDAAQAKQIESGVMIYRTNRLGDLWTIKTIDGGLRLKENIKGFNRAMKIAQKNGWKVVKTIPKNPKDVKESTKKFTKEGTESNPRFKCMEGNNEYSDDIREFREDIINVLKEYYGGEYYVEPGMDGKSILVTDGYAGIDYKIDISVSDEVDM